MIPYGIPEWSHVTLRVFDILGRTVATLVDGPQEAGNHYVVFSGRELASGMYLYRLQAGNFSMTKKMLVIR